MTWLPGSAPYARSCGHPSDAGRRPASRAKPALTAAATLARLNRLCDKSRPTASCDLLERSWANPSGTQRGAIFDNLRKTKAALAKLGKELGKTGALGAMHHRAHPHLHREAGSVGCCIQ